MKRTLHSLSASIGVLAVTALPLPAQEETPVAGEIAAAATAFLATLDEAGRDKVVYDFKDDEQRRRWSNLPPSMVERGGLRMGDLTAVQREAAMGLLKVALSPRGFEKARRIVDANEALKQGAGRSGIGRDEYFISLLGQPSATEPWMLQFGGHHLGLNLTFVGDRGTLAPSHTGAHPAIFEFHGKSVRPLGGETDKAFALLTSLDETQRKKAVIGAERHDLVLGPGRDGEMVEPEGIKGSDLTEKQREALLELAGEWTGMAHETVAKAKMDELKKHVADTWFALSGPTDRAGHAYFRIQGPTVVIEYAPQGMGGDPSNHVHTVYRDPTNDYGAQWWKR